MSNIRKKFTASGVCISDDYRDNLIVDRFHPCFVSMRQSKKNHLKSENSEDAISWNVFRSLRQINPEIWVPQFFEVAFGGTTVNSTEDTTVFLWRDVAPPPALLQSGDEGISEIDIVIENPSWVMFIEAKYKGDISGGTTTRPNRDQVLRNIDVGSYYSGVRPFYFALLCLDEKHSPKGISAIEKYKNSNSLKSALPHRDDRIENLQDIGLLTWSDMAAILKHALELSERRDEQIFTERALDWLHEKNIHPPQ